MSGKTHIAAGAALGSVGMLGFDMSLGALEGVLGRGSPFLGSLPTSLVFVILGAFLGACGAMCPDLDVVQSEGNKFLQRCSVVAVSGLVAVVVTTMILDVPLPGLQVPVSSIIGVIGCVLLLLLMRIQPHRGFSHSFVACFSMTACLSSFLPMGFCLSFCVGYLSHLLLDFLNKKGEMIWWPAKSRVCLEWCSASGAADTVIRYVSLAALAMVAVIEVYHVY